MVSNDYPPGWYVIADTVEIPADRPVTLPRFGTKLVLFRGASGALAALDDRCPHRGSSLGLGRVVDGCVACPFHGFRFGSDGACVAVPVLGSAARIPKALRATSYPVREVDGWVWLWWGAAPAELPEVPAFAHLREGFRQRTIAREWAASYVRVIENQLDPFHLPFVHRTTIGRRMPEAMRVWSEAGEDHVRAGIDRDDRAPREFYVELRWANLWENHVSPRMSIVAAFAPIDAGRTRTYLRTYQRFVTVPVVGWLFDAALAASNRRIFSQDERVVVSQPQAPLLAEDEVLIKPDAAIIAYRKMFRRKSMQGAPAARDDAPAEPSGDDDGDAPVIDVDALTRRVVRGPNAPS
jgi:phenylpropionate dioxygenase-like ring-hydroxylating dioxygenase large terminal subunit